MRINVEDIYVQQKISTKACAGGAVVNVLIYQDIGHEINVHRSTSNGMGY